MRTIRFALLLAAALPFTAMALQGIEFHHKDWEIACDNSGACRAAGYQPEKFEAHPSHPNPLTVLLERHAGTNSQITAQLRLAGDEETIPQTLALQIGSQNLGNIQIHTRTNTYDHPRHIGLFNPQQTRSLLEALKGNTLIRFTAGTQSWQLSNEGANAVFLKMDEFQRRIGTASALIRPGKQTGNPLQPQAVPLIYAASVPRIPPREIHPDAREFAGLMRRMRQMDKEKACHLFEPTEHRQPSMTIHPLGNNRVLVAADCTVAAYNGNTFYLLMDSALTQVHQSFDLEDSFNHYEDGVLEVDWKYRGMGDCGIIHRAIWNGQQFVPHLTQTRGSCRGFPGGAWPLPTFVSEVRR